MRQARRLRLLTFLASFATILVERAEFFYARDRLAFTDAARLWLALAFGVAYVAGALSSHRLARRLGERRLLVILVAGQILLYAALAVRAQPVTLFVLSTLIGAGVGAFWPVVESYVSAGHTPRQTLKAVGRFNLAWALAVPLAMLAAGPMIDLLPPSLFAAGAALWTGCLGLILPLPPRPVHLPADHPERLTARQGVRVRALLASSRWLMLASYSCLWILAALLPRTFEELGYRARTGSGMSGVIDAFRVSAFLALQAWHGWYGRSWPLLLAMGLLPAGFFLVLFGGWLPAVVAGEVLFGLAAGQIYYAALYYAMVAKSASVDAGGAHEGLIGTGFAVGPAAGLLAVALMPHLGSEVLGMLAGVGPLLVLCTVAALLPMLRTWRAASRGHRL